MKRSSAILAALAIGYLIGSVTPWANAHEETDCAPPPPCPECPICEIDIGLETAEKAEKAEAIRKALEAIQTVEEYGQTKEQQQRQ
jgi:hypothetical protein